LTRTREIPTRCAEDPAYGSLKNDLIARTGLAYYDERDDLLSETIGRRLAQLGLPDCGSYAEFLADGGRGRAEMETLIAQLTVGETYFFRDPEQFDALRRVVLPEILDRKQSVRQLRIWSAGCANGAEPYSLAILLGREMRPRIAGWEISILSTDMNQQSLAEAREGKFREWAFRATSDAVKHECFSQDRLGWTILPEFQRWTSFAPLNLVASGFRTAWHRISNFDLILCRNVMIYFSAEVTRRLIGQFHASLADKGWLLVGATEHNADNFSAFRTVQAPGATVYQRVDLAAQPVPALPPPERPHPALPASPPLDIESLRSFADRGDWASALRHCEGMLAQDGSNPAVYFYHALVLEQMGIQGEAEQSLRRAIYLDRNFAMAHFHLGLVMKREKDDKRAARSFQNVLRILSGMAKEQFVVDGDGVTVEGLRGLARIHLRKAEPS
jgi:chemotaxis protein methyltransferase CheR